MTTERPNQNQIADFLRLLFLSVFGGFFGIFSLEDRVTEWFATNECEAAAEYVADRALTQNVYFCNGAQSERLRRSSRGSADTVIAIPGFWIDVDFDNPHRARHDLPANGDEAEKLLRALLFEPTVVDYTGYGLQAGYLFREPLVFANDAERQFGKDLANRFQSYATSSAGSLGFHLDNVAALGHAFRIPGTFNRKRGGQVPVEIVHLDPDRRYNPSELDELLPPLPFELPRFTSRAAISGDFPPARLDRIVASCPWMRHCVYGAANLPEPEWYAALSIVGRCVDADAHAFSRGYRKYNPQETQRKLEQALRQSGPRTCANIAANGGAGYCANCGHRGTIGSPIALGMRRTTTFKSLSELEHKHV